ncbi:hypothetical protein [Paenibacillus sp. GYB003]|uniref:hypothetical protein n=1 Tax=Paenibacillus sp. GYB003 TaxID=2994392 RepID=UPI002F96CD6A
MKRVSNIDFSIDINAPFAHLSDEDLEKAWQEYRSLGDSASWRECIINGVILQLQEKYEVITIGVKKAIPSKIHVFSELL